MSIWFLLFHLLFRCVDLPRLLLMYPRLHQDFMFWLTEALCAFVMNTPFQFNFSFLKAPRDYLISINCNEIILFSSSRFPHTVQRLCFYAYLIVEDYINLSLVTGTSQAGAATSGALCLPLLQTESRMGSIPGSHRLISGGCWQNVNCVPDR